MRRKIRKVAAVFLSCVSAFVMVACGSNDSLEKTTSNVVISGDESLNEELGASSKETGSSVAESETTTTQDGVTTPEETTTQTEAASGNQTGSENEGAEGQTATTKVTSGESQTTTKSQTTNQSQTTTKQQATNQSQTTSQSQTTKQQTTNQSQTTTKQTTNQPQTTTKQQTTTQPQTTTTAGTTNLTDEQRAEKLLAEMTLEEKVGQMFIARCPSSNARELAKEYQLGGYILFARDFDGKTKTEVINNISGYQEVSSIPMFIGVDEEGGKVVRVSKYTEFRSEAFKSPQELFSLGGYDLIRSDAIEKSRLLKSLGINVNFAPVADVCTDTSGFIYGRTFGLDATATSQYIKTVVAAMNSENMGSVLKHFPGYGNNEDTHEGIAYDERDYNSFVTSDFLPFQAGISEGASMVMVAHNVVYCMDSTYPASLSVKVHNILRNELGFDGVIITDELSMDGVTQFADDDTIAVLAVQAGNDLLCCTNFEEQIAAVIAAVKDGTISEERINESVIRILKLKMSLGIL